MIVGITNIILLYFKCWINVVGDLPSADISLSPDVKSPNAGISGELLLIVIHNIGLSLMLFHPTIAELFTHNFMSHSLHVSFSLLCQCCPYWLPGIPLRLACCAKLHVVQYFGLSVERESMVKSGNG